MAHYRNFQLTQSANTYTNLRPGSIKFFKEEGEKKRIEKEAKFCPECGAPCEPGMERCSAGCQTVL